MRHASLSRRVPLPILRLPGAVLLRAVRQGAELRQPQRPALAQISLRRLFRRGRAALCRAPADALLPVRADLRGARDAAATGGSACRHESPAWDGAADGKGLRVVLSGLLSQTEGAERRGPHR